MKILVTISFALFVAAISSLANVARAEQTAQRNWHFQVYLDDRPIGYHQFSLSQKDGQHQLHSEAEFHVTVFFINVYSYRHKNTEIWQDACLTQLSSHTNDDGSSQFVHLQPLSGDDAMQLTSAAGNQRVTGCIRSFAYWNRDLLQSSHLLNPQTGELLDVSFTRIGRDTLMMGNKAVDSIAYRLTADKQNIQLWYSNEGDWLALQSTTDDGYQLRYVLSEEAGQ